MATIALLTAIVLLGLAGQVNADYKDDIDYTALRELLGEGTPDGSGIVVSQVEACDAEDCNPVRYMPNTADAEFVGKMILDGTGTNTTSSSHATPIGRLFYGNTSSLAQGITEVTVYEAGAYLEDVLNVQGGDPTTQSFAVQNHSWISTGYEHTNGAPHDGLNLQALQRFDYVIDTQDMTAVIGLNNGGSSQPLIWAHSYNSIAVGRSDGGHSQGKTTFHLYNPGRMKPDLVAPRPTTSSATAVTSSLATLLHDSGTGTDATKTESMKAILLAGATKQEFSSWSRTTTEPLDAKYGAGEINALNSYQIQAGGEFDGSTSEPTQTVGVQGWDYEEIAPGGSLYYTFEVPEYHSFDELSIALTWNINIIDNSPATSVFSPSHSMADLNLKFYDSSTSFMGTLLDESVSEIDNVEHLYLKSLSEGKTYTLEITATSGRDFGLAWRLESTPPHRVTGDYNEDGVVDAGDYSLWRDTFGSGTDLRADGDLSGTVDDADYLIWRGAFGTLLSAPASLGPGISVPEPAALALILMVISTLGLWRTLRRRDIGA